MDAALAAASDSFSAAFALACCACPRQVGRRISACDEWGQERGGGGGGRMGGGDIKWGEWALTMLGEKGGGGALRLVRLAWAAALVSFSASAMAERSALAAASAAVSAALAAFFSASAAALASCSASLPAACSASAAVLGGGGWGGAGVGLGWGGVGWGGVGGGRWEGARTLHPHLGFSFSVEGRGGSASTPWRLPCQPALSLLRQPSLRALAPQLPPT